MELGIFFKNVRQGDTIFLHWNDNSNQKKFGLIDCNLVNGKIDCVIDHIINYSIKYFEFVVLSHPHSDHFSGFAQLFAYCEKYGIVIDKFIHTSVFDPIRLERIFEKEVDDSEFYKLVTAPVNRIGHKEDLWSFFTILDAQQQKKPKGFIKEVFTISNDYMFLLNSDFTLKFLSPFQHDEHDKYLKETFQMSDDDKSLLMPENNPKSNLLSSVIQIMTSNDSHQVLLTSDTTKFTMTRLLERNHAVEKLKNAKLLAAQIPHHGSFYNHSIHFWDTLIGLNEGVHFFISVGEGYGHPSRDVVEYFDKMGTVHATNNVGGYRQFYSSGETSLFDFSMDIMTMFDKKEPGPSTRTTSPFCGEQILKIVKSDDRLLCEVTQA